MLPSPEREPPASLHARHSNEAAGSLTDALPWGPEIGDTVHVNRKAE